jgi:hypothetical protein
MPEIDNSTTGAQRHRENLNKEKKSNATSYFFGLLCASAPL